MNKIRVGVIGASPSAGFGTYAHVPAVKALPQYELTAVATTRQESADETARRFGVPHAFARAGLLIEHPEVDLVVVSVRVTEHASLVRAALAARKHVFCEWPLGVSAAQTADLTSLAESSGVRHVIGLQRRLGPGVRYLRDLIAEGYIGKVRSATIHAALPLMGERRPAAYAYQVDAANGATVLSIFAAHYLDTLFTAVGEPRELSAVVARQFEKATLVETGEVLPVTSPDQVLISGTLTSGAVLSAHFEGGKRNGGAVRCVITGTEGDLALNEDFTVSGAKGDGNPLQPMPTPERYSWLPPSTLSNDVQLVGHVYAALARDLTEGTKLAPTFGDALRLHRLLDTISEASATGRRQGWNVQAS